LNTEIEHQWRLTQNQLPEEEFVSYEKQNNIAGCKERNWNRKKYEENRPFIFMLILILRLKKLIPPIVDMTESGQRRQTWNKSPPY
jgi:hypothetical protein